ncbi:DHA2 family efflux MFS transporter permease subunit [Chloroflexi bacterium TSY]|nr:DHA2 family efflux MFS transporter permease subunit [Chloroflexi bacterium TSY]
MTIITTASSSPAVDYSRKWYVMLAIGLSLFLETIDTSIVNVALPTLVRTFAVDFSIVQWVVLAFVLTQATLMLVVGRLGDMVGKKRIFIAGLFVASIGSILCGLAPGIWWLIAFRVMQGIGVAMAMALGMGIVTEAFPAAERGLALGTIGGIVSVGIVIGPIVGGWLLETLSWRWIFFMTVPLALIDIPFAQRYLPDSRPIDKQRFDFIGAGTFFLFLLLFLLGMTVAQQEGYGTQSVLILFSTSALFLILFTIIEFRIEQPVIDVRLFQSNLFGINLLLRLLSFIIFIGVLLLLPFYLENIRGFSPRHSGILVTVPSICFGIAAPAAGRLSDRFGSHRIVIAGLGLMLWGCYSLGTLTETTSLFGYVWRLIPFGLGMGVFQAPNNSIVFGLVPVERLGMTSGLMSVVRTLGRSFGIAIIGGFWTSRIIYYAGEQLTGGVTEANTSTQLAGMQDAFILAAIIMVGALLLSVWSFWKAQ